MEYATLGLVVLLLAGVAAVWSRLSAQRTAIGRCVDLLQRQDGVFTGLKADLTQTRTELRDDQSRHASEAREEQSRLRAEVRTDLAAFRAELAGSMQSLRHDVDQRSTTSETRIDALSQQTLQQLDAVREQLETRLERIRTDSATAVSATREETLQSLQQYRTALLDTLEQLRAALLAGVDQSRSEQTQRLSDVTARLDSLTSATEQRLEALRGSVDGRLQEIRTDNAARLEQMRATVDEKLQSTLELRLGESFRTVSQHLESVQRGLGEMQNLASGVGDLRKVLTNVKVRGGWGEMQLGMILEQFLSPEQFECHFAAKENSSERVEFAVRFPGRAMGTDEPVWVPIDSKFPQEDYLRMVEAYENADSAALEAAAKSLEQTLRRFAKDVSDKYINPPRTTPFAIIYLPTEGLFAEAVRRPGLLEDLQRQYRITLTGPTTIAAVLTAFQAGFRTLAIQQRSDEVWNTLGKVKSEFGKFGGVLEKVQKKLHDAGRSIDDVHVRTRAIERSLRTVEALPVAAGHEILLPVSDDDEELVALPTGALPSVN